MTVSAIQASWSRYFLAHGVSLDKVKEKKIDLSDGLDEKERADLGIKDSQFDVIAAQGWTLNPANSALAGRKVITTEELEKAEKDIEQYADLYTGGRLDKAYERYLGGKLEGRDFSAEAKVWEDLRKEADKPGANGKTIAETLAINYKPITDRLTEDRGPADSIKIIRVILEASRYSTGVLPKQYNGEYTLEAIKEFLRNEMTFEDIKVGEPTS
ncbi:MAG: hypothetical protein ABIJ26_04470 [Candidatus Margulisiibacteriota bacterium]